MLFLFLIIFILNPINASRIRSLNKTCTVKHAQYFLIEGDEITLNKKLYKVEDCKLQRAFQACSTHLWFMINIVCQAIEQQKGKATLENRFRRFVQEKLLSEACCQNTCTIHEMTRYCPS